MSDMQAVRDRAVGNRRTWRMGAQTARRPVAVTRDGDPDPDQDSPVSVAQMVREAVYNALAVIFLLLGGVMAAVGLGFYLESFAAGVSLFGAMLFYIGVQLGK